MLIKVYPQKVERYGQLRRAYSLEILKLEIDYYSWMIPIYLLLIGILLFLIYRYTNKIKTSEFYQSFDSKLKYLSQMLFENGGYIGIFILCLLIADANLYSNYRKPRLYFEVRGDFLPHIVYMTPYFISSIFLWFGFDLKRGMKKDYLTFAVFVLWLLSLGIFLLGWWLLGDMDHSHMP